MCTFSNMCCVLMVPFWSLYIWHKRVSYYKLVFCFLDMLLQSLPSPFSLTMPVKNKVIVIYECLL